MTAKPSAAPVTLDDTPMSPDERDAVAAAFEAELAAEHEQRVARARKMQARTAARANRLDSEQRVRETNKIKEKVRAEFHAKQGYKRYFDSTGRELWLTAEEFELRTKRRKHRRRVFEPEAAGRTRTVLFYLGLLLVAVVMGFLLAR